LLAREEGRAERSMAALRKLSMLQARVLRDGCKATVAACTLVPGDILLLAAGDAVGADARLIDEATGLGDRRNMVGMLHAGVCA
jgi:magnesium-transporting ATPase (P-type)